VFVGVRLADIAAVEQRAATATIVADVVSSLDLLSKWLLEIPPLERFRDPRVMVEG
jgi:hypothetical protein